MSSFSISRPRLPYRSRLGWLPASLALNLILIGLVLAWVWNMPPPPRRPLVTWQRELIPSLSPGDAALTTEAAGRIAEAQSAGDQAVHAQYNKVRALLAVEPLDRAALEAAFTEMARIRHNQQVEVGDAFFDELAAVSPQGRQKILASMEKESLHWHPSPGR
jgi:hypothetical protein